MINLKGGYLPTALGDDDDDDDDDEDDDGLSNHVLDQLWYTLR